jgi:hypothetical protein
MTQIYRHTERKSTRGRKTERHTQTCINNHERHLLIERKVDSGRARGRKGEIGENRLGCTQRNNVKDRRRGGEEERRRGGEEERRRREYLTILSVSDAPD